MAPGSSDNGPSELPPRLWRDDCSRVTATGLRSAVPLPSSDVCTPLLPMSSRRELARAITDGRYGLLTTVDADVLTSARPLRLL